MYNDKEKVYTGWDYDEGFSTVKTFTYQMNNFFMDCLMSDTDCLNKVNYIEKKKDNSFIKKVRFTGCGMYDKYLLRKVYSFKNGIAPTEHVLLSNLLLSNTDLSKNDYKKVFEKAYDDLNRRLVANNFTDFLDNMRDDYYNLIDNYIINLEKNSQEYMDLIEMINDVIDTLKYRADYYSEKNKETVLNEIIQNLDNEQKEVLKGGLLNPYQNKKPRSESPKNLSQIEQILPEKIKIPEHIQNIDYYERYFATPQEFKKIINRLKL
jgi:hypothetical protein